MAPARLAALTALAALVCGWPAAAAAHPAAPCIAGTRQPVGDGSHAQAVVSGPHGVVARAAPHGGAPLAGRFGPRTAEGVSSVFSVRERLVDAGCAARWLHVLLPRRPNGASGWIPADAVSASYVVRSRIVIDVSRRRLELYRAGRLAYALTVAVGRSDTPTPIGRYYVTERLYTEDPAGAYGPAALGLSAFSPVLVHWTQGGPVGIHGTNRPASIGQAASNGCIRVPNERVLRLLRDVAAGTPVLIHP